MATLHPRGVVYACVAHNPSKTYPVGPEARCEIVRRACAAAGLGDRVKAVVVPGYPWRFAVWHEVSVMYRGIRTWAKDGRAESVLHVLNSFAPMFLDARLPPATRFLEAQPELVHLSSTKVRKKAAAGEGVGGMVPAAVEARIAELYSR